MVKAEAYPTMSGFTSAFSLSNKLHENTLPFLIVCQ